mgnify:FL=1
MNFFTLDPSDDIEMLLTAIEEALEYKIWVDGPDDGEVPAFMKWKEGMPSYTMIPMDERGMEVETYQPLKPRAPVTRNISSNSSPRKRAMLIYADHVSHNIPKAETIRVFIEELKLRPATAQVYYSNAKTLAAQA